MLLYLFERHLSCVITSLFSFLQLMAMADENKKTFLNLLGEIVSRKRVRLMTEIKHTETELETFRPSGTETFIPPSTETFILDDADK